MTSSYDPVQQKSIEHFFGKSYIRKKSDINKKSDLNFKKIRFKSKV